MTPIEPGSSANAGGWLQLRQGLWPDCPQDEHQAEIQQILAEPQRYGCWLACTENGEAVGLAEAALRHDYVNGTDSSPVVFLQGIYVAPGHRRQGIAQRLIEQVAYWGQQRGCVEMASDTSLDNLASQDLHHALGFEETERVVYFKKRL
ncbi:aminoglycoside 6'-N-acetyltransferase [Pseudomonas protegens]|uniref:aminoglycoside 6'-N-acetyltransferase n=1 Tax=Pseudomonas protegens TaxID=380021 RepID=UPI0005A03A3E|nr:aminoglycoside 6'-N-acetyltransferase [Pseudomonas protegens]MBP5108351.1 GNAT family N-acetyltransferase [Pseudomonas protegens]QTU28865.1 GNAT family N-acetyltransferase [Pseudomonas protegens]QTU34874.1 GNAT family N-acetyltransferase [Pseudomonas protegens]RLO23247.1 GNAT family N-acetyltransferase [Pseudomonas protegens]